MNDTRAQQAFDNFSNSSQRLEEALAMPFTTDVRDIAILRFMFTYETAWKAFKWVLKEELLIDAKHLSPYCKKPICKVGLAMMILSG